MNFRIISYYTPTYEDIAKKYLLPSIKKLNLLNYIEICEWENSWKENTDYKAILIRKCLDKFKENLIFIDCDAEILAYPKLFEENFEGYDLGCHYLNWELHYGRPTDKGKKELLSGTLMFINNSNKIRPLVDKWIEETKKFSWEQMALDFVIMPDIKIYELPREYCYITTRPNGKPPAVPLTNPIIIHHQAGRTLKRLV